MLCIVDMGLTEIGWHYFNYDSALAEAAINHGQPYMILAPKSDLDTGQLAVRKVLPDLSKVRFRRVQMIPVMGPQIRLLALNLAFFVRLRSALPVSGIGPDWVIFDPMISPNHFLGWLIWLILLPKNCKGKVVFLFMRPLESLSGKLFLQLTVYLLKWTSQRIDLHLCTESELAQREAARITGLSWEILPLPLGGTDQLIDNSSSASDSRKKFASLGVARSDKGFNLLMQMLLLLAETGELSHYEFFIQFYQPRGIDQTLVQRVERLHADNIHFYKQPLSKETYYDLLRGADVILLPYRSTVYSKSGSGVFTEAVSLGKPVIATEGTWMSEQMEAYGSGVLFRDNDTADLARAIREMTLGYEYYKDKAQRAKLRWRDMNSPEALYTCLFQPETHTNV